MAKGKKQTMDVDTGFDLNLTVRIDIPVQVTFDPNTATILVDEGKDEMVARVHETIVGAFADLAKAVKEMGT